MVSRSVASSGGGRVRTSEHSRMKREQAMNTQRKHALITLLLGAVFWSSWALAIPQATSQDIVLVLDNSGSMRKFDPNLTAKTAANDFLQGLPAEINIAVVIFDQTVRLVSPFALATDSAKVKLKASLEGLNYRGLFTDGPGAIERAIYELKTNGRADATRTIIFVSDGIVDTGEAAKDAERAKWLREQLAKEAATHKIRILPIAFTENADLLMIQSLASSTGGDYVRAPAPDDLATAYRVTQERLFALAAPTPVVAPPAPAAPEVPTPEAVALPESPATPVAPGPVTPEPTEAVTLPSPVTPEPIQAATPQPVESAEPGAGSGASALSAEEMAALEQLAKDTGVPVEQLLSELDSAPDGQAVVVRPPDAAPAGSGLPTSGMALVLAGGGLAALVGLVVWFVMRGRGGAPATSSGVLAPKAATAQQTASEAFLIDLHGLTGDPARRITDKPVMVGRTAGTDPEYLDYFVVNKATVGRRHAIIKFKDNSFWVIDQGSVNGTYVNNEKVMGERQLRHGDRIKFHKFEFEFSFPDRSDPGKTVIGVIGDQTIVASHDSTMSATSASLRGTSTSVIAAAAGGASPVADSDTGAWLNEKALDDVPGHVPAAAPSDVTREGDLDSLESDREAFFSSSGSQSAFVAPSDTPSGDDTFDDDAFGMLQAEAPKDAFDEDGDEDLGVEINLDAIGEADNTRLIHKDTAAASNNDFDADASAFFDTNTVGPAADLMEGPSAADDSEADFLDITKVPGIGDDDATANYVPPDTVLSGRRPGEATGTKPPLDTGIFGELTTVTRDSEARAEEINDDFLETGSFTAPAKPPREAPKLKSKDSISVEDFVSTGLFDESQLTNEDATILPTAVADEVFDRYRDARSNPASRHHRVAEYTRKI
ncbi:MAG: FHA domain-containing protein [Gammaproteobacteria bacterium]|nr:FHA domain-containing protein [Gammaproteobacteria bacterium]